MWRTLRQCWALFFGILVLMLGTGLQGSLLSLRADAAGFPETVTGLVMSAYYVGFLVGWALVPEMIRRVGHVRVFAALGSIASTTILLHALFVDPTAWFVVRLLTGAALCGVFITTESWLNAGASNENRGQVLGAYMVVLLGGIALGQFLLNLAAPTDTALFMLVAVLLSLAIVPILVSISPAPVVTAARRLPLARLFLLSPLGAVGVGVIGLAHGTIYGGIGPLYARALGLSVADVAWFMALTIAGGMICQWPIAWLSDRFDRRIVLTVVTLLAAAVCLAAALAAAGRPQLVFVLFFFVGGLSLPLYSLCVAHANDFMSREEMVGASGAMLLVNATGSALGPSIGAAMLQLGGPAGFPLYLAAVHAALGGFALWRMTRRAAVPVAEQGPTIPLTTPAPTPVAAAMAQETAVERSAPGREPPTIASAA